MRRNTRKRKRMKGGSAGGAEQAQLAAQASASLPPGETDDLTMDMNGVEITVTSENLASLLNNRFTRLTTLQLLDREGTRSPKIMVAFFEWNKNLPSFPCDTWEDVASILRGKGMDDLADIATDTESGVTSKFFSDNNQKYIEMAIIYEEEKAKTSRDKIFPKYIKITDGVNYDTDFLYEVGYGLKTPPPSPGGGAMKLPEESPLKLANGIISRLTAEETAAVEGDPYMGF